METIQTMSERAEPSSGVISAARPGLLLHATCLSIDGRGVLLRGPSGAGKSDLALRMILQPLLRSPWAPSPPAGFLEVRLVSDDQVRVLAEQGALWALAPTAIAGKLEVRGLGIVGVPHAPRCQLALIADLVPSARIERLPPEGRTETLLSVALPRVELDPFEASAPAKLALALASLGGHF